MDEPSIQLDPADVVDDSTDVNTPVETQETTTEESSAEESKAPEVAEEASTDESESEAEPEGDLESTDEAPQEEQPRGKAEERKLQLNEEIRDLVSQRNSIRTEVERLNSQVYQTQDPQELVDQGYSETDAKVEALRQQIEMRDYNDRVAEAQLSIGSESQRVLEDFPIFNPESDQFKPDVAGRAANLLRKNLQVDPNTGQVIGSNVSPYELYQTIAAAHEASAVDNQIKGQKATEKMLAAVDAPSSAAPKQAPEDPFLVGLTKGLKT